MIILADCLFNLISGGLPFTLTVLVGGYLTLKTRFFQFRNFKKSFSVLKGEKSTGISGFSAMCNSLSAAVGTGNIVGVSAAISLGGAGAIFWMWVSAFLGMIIKSAEIVLGVFYRKKISDGYIGGPHIYIKNGLPINFKTLGCFFAFIGVFATFFCGNMTQVNSAVSLTVHKDEIKWIIGIIIGVVVLFTIRGGTAKIATILSNILPVMAVGYIILCLGVVFKNFSVLPLAFKSIFIGAFSPSAVSGGVVGSIFTALSVGASKGIFSNEAGVGTAAIAHSLVEDAIPQKQSLYGIFEVFVDTIVLCSLTALTILSSGVIIDYGKASSFDLVFRAFSNLYGSSTGYILSAMLIIFGVSSVLGWATYGISFSEFLLGLKGKKLFIWVYPVFCVFGAVVPGIYIWKIAELLNGILVIINLLIILYLSQTVLGIFKEKVNDKKQNYNASGKLKR